MLVTKKSERINDKAKAASVLYEMRYENRSVGIQVSLISEQFDDG